MRWGLLGTQVVRQHYRRPSDEPNIPFRGDDVSINQSNDPYEETLNGVQDLLDLHSTTPFRLMHTTVRERGPMLSLLLIVCVIVGLKVYALQWVTHSTISVWSQRSAFVHFTALTSTLVLAMVTTAVSVLLIATKWSTVDAFVPLPPVTFCAIGFLKGLGTALQLLSAPSLDRSTTVWLSSYSLAAFLSCAVPLGVSVIPRYAHLFYHKMGSLHTLTPTALVLVGILLCTLQRFVVHTENASKPFYFASGSLLHGFALLYLENFFYKKDVYPLYVTMHIAACEFFCGAVALLLLTIPDFGGFTWHQLSEVLVPGDSELTASQAGPLVLFAMIYALETYAWTMLARWGNSSMLWATVTVAHPAVTIFLMLYDDSTFSTVQILGSVALSVGSLTMTLSSKFFYFTASESEYTLRKAQFSVRMGATVLCHRTLDQSRMAYLSHIFGFIPTACEPTVSAPPVGLTMFNTHGVGDSSTTSGA